MIRAFYLFVVFFVYQNIYAQPNCEVFKYNGDTLKYEACKKAMGIKGQYQFSKEYQSILNESLKIDSTFDYAYWAKSIAYLKSGDFITWKKLIDKAVDLNPVEYLGYRGWCRYQFFRDYEGAINDIEALEKIKEGDIAYSQNGTYHLKIVKGLCYKAIGKKDKAIEIIENQLIINEKIDFVGQFDYLHLGVLYLETNQLERAIETFNKQSISYELAENQYYLALTYLQLKDNDKYISCLLEAKALYLKGSKVMDVYDNPMDKIYLTDIENKL
ncbi:hypothetical protein EQG68_11765 [Flavobacterium piscinae]|uniref:Tetratricopeptide repeat protein n=1 Tax=Flavobacterium piscinae TaxID=2506424 RepID=A0A4Q1KJS0_9FLAO|nr:hypothetical protein [Flavobacterium piscinae]RXR30101.1 hypothetical protein EQG68_11765 [Flavobacterium piscinae]